MTYRRNRPWKERLASPIPEGTEPVQVDVVEPEPIVPTPIQVVEDLPEEVPTPEEEQS